MIYAYAHTRTNSTDNSQLTNEQTTLFLYLLLQGNSNVASFILSRSDIDLLVSPHPSHPLSPTPSPPLSPPLTPSPPLSPPLPLSHPLSSSLTPSYPHLLPSHPFSPPLTSFHLLLSSLTALSHLFSPLSPPLSLPFPALSHPFSLLLLSLLSSFLFPPLTLTN